MTRRELDPWVEGYLSYLGDVRRLSPRTIVDVRCSLKKVGVFMEQLRPAVSLWKLTLDDYLCWLNDERDQGGSENVLAKQLSHIRGLLEYAWRSGRADRNVLDGFSLQDSVRVSAPRVLTLEEAGRLVQACPSQTRAQRRSRLVVLLLYGCGLRTSELCGLDVQDVDVERQELFVKKAKGHRQRTIPVPSAVWTALLAYMTERGGETGCAVSHARQAHAHPPEGSRADRQGGNEARGARGQGDSADSATHLRHPPHGSGCGPGGDRLAHGAPHSAGDGRLPARIAGQDEVGGWDVGRGPRTGGAMKWDYWLQLYLTRHCVARGLMPRTIAAYDTTLQGFRAYVRFRLEDRGPDELCARDILDYVEYLRRERNNGASAVNRQVTILKCFYRAIVAMGHLDVDDNPMAHFPKIKAAPIKLPVFLSEQEVRQLIAHPRTDTVLGLRDRALLMLLYGTGIRATECATLTEEAVDLIP